MEKCTGASLNIWLLRKTDSELPMFLCKTLQGHCRNCAEFEHDWNTLDSIDSPSEPLIWFVTEKEARDYIQKYEVQNFEPIRFTAAEL